MNDLKSKYLVFSIGIENYGVPILGVKEIIRYEKITPIRDSEKYLRGVINLRGKVIPIVDMRFKFGMEDRDYDDRTVFVIVELNAVDHIYFIGMAVDAVQEVYDIADVDIEPPPEVGLKMKKHFLEGIAKVKEKMIMLLNVEKILTTDEIVTIADKAS